MLEHEALSQMVAPGQPRRGTWRNGTIQIWVTRACDRSCPNCTQGSNLKPYRDKSHMFMSLDNFETAVRSLEDYFGVVGIFGGNPVLHPQFDTLCEILSSYIHKSQRGVWCNNPLGKGRLLREVFNPSYSNLNVHGNAAAYDEFVRDWPESHPFGLSPSTHAPVHGSMLDLGTTEGERWRRIANCDLNQRWSALIGQFRGEPRAWFCEIAGSQSMLWQEDERYPDTGMYPEPGWWKRSMQEFAEQARHHCHRCLVPLKGKGSMDNDTESQITQEYQPVYQLKKGSVKVIDEYAAAKPFAKERATAYNEAIG